jgi:hypothetical protein
MEPLAALAAGQEAGEQIEVASGTAAMIADDVGFENVRCLLEQMPVT